MKLKFLNISLYGLPNSRAEARECQCADFQFIQIKVIKTFVYLSFQVQNIYFDTDFPKI